MNTKVDKQDTSNYTPLKTDIFKVISSVEHTQGIVDEVAAMYCSTGCLIRNRVYSNVTMEILHQDTNFVEDVYIHETFSHENQLVRRYIKRRDYRENKD